MKKKAMDEGCEKKERHIVMWTQEDDDILRKQISIHGTDNWTIIASKFKDKTTRQCRRRWYTYLNSDFKKGGWSPEEDMLLCEAQKIFGNKWTEIAKVVTGRTDNAVKNRFTTLCKKRAKHETLAKENNNITYVNPNNNRGLFSTNQALEAPSPIKRMRRTHISALSECSHSRTESTRECEANNQRRPPLAVLSQNLLKLGDISTQHLHKNAKGDLNAEAIGNKTPQATYLKKDDPKINALMQQAELLSSLAQKVNGENTDQSLESAWKVLQDFLSRTELNDVLKFKPPDMGFQHDELKDLIEDSRGSNEGSQPSWRQPDLHESPCGSEYSTTSTLVWQKAGDKSEQIKDETYALKDVEDGILAIHDAERNSEHECTNVIPSDVATGQETFSSCCEQKAHGRIVAASSCTEFGSPLQVTPLFRSLGTGIPSPKFSESERSFLMKAFGMESPSTNSSQPPPCKKALLHSL